MSRLVMNHIQMEYGVLPSKVLKEHKIGYIKSLQDSRTNGNPDIFCRFMLEEHIANVKAEIGDYRKSMDGDAVMTLPQPIPVAEMTALETQILEILRNGESCSAAKLAERLSVSSRQVQRVLASLKQRGIIRHEGSNKSGAWRTEVDF